MTQATSARPSAITPARAAKALDRAVDVLQLFSVLAALLGVLTGGQLVVDDNTAGWAVIAGALLAGAVGYLLACWARAWQTDQS